MFENLTINKNGTDWTHCCERRSQTLIWLSEDNEIAWPFRSLTMTLVMGEVWPRKEAVGRDLSVRKRFTDGMDSRIGFHGLCHLLQVQQVIGRVRMS